MIDSIQPLSTSIIATVRRDAVAAVPNNIAPPTTTTINTATESASKQTNPSLDQSFGQKNTDNVFTLPSRANTAAPQDDFSAAQNAETQAQASNYQPQSTPTKGAYSYASSAYRLASNFTAFPTASTLNFAV